MSFPKEFRLDDAQSRWFEQQLTSVDQRQYEILTAPALGRSFIPTQPNVPEWAAIYKWRMLERIGKAKFIADNATDIPRVDVVGTESAKIIRPCASSYGWNLFEIKAAQATNTPLDAERAATARQAVEQLVDETLATGSDLLNLEGLLNLSEANSFTLNTKAAGGKTWAVATADEILADVRQMISARIGAMKQAGGQVFNRFTLLLPDTVHADIAMKRIGDGSSTTILNFLLEASKTYIDGIEPWYRCVGAGALGVNRAVLYPKNPMVISGLVPMEFTQLPAEQQSLEYVVNCVASCGGVVCRYPVAVAYADGL